MVETARLAGMSERRVMGWEVLLGFEWGMTGESGRGSESPTAKMSGTRIGVTYNIGRLMIGEQSSGTRREEV